MLNKTPPNPAAQVSAEYELSFQWVADEVAHRLARLAKVKDQQAFGRLLNKVIRIRWLGLNQSAALQHRLAQLNEIEREAEVFLSHVERLAELSDLSFREGTAGMVLAVLKRHTNALTEAGNLAARWVGEDGTPGTTTSELPGTKVGALTALRDWAEKRRLAAAHARKATATLLGNPGRLGRRRGDLHLHALVFNLEQIAQSCGGRFTVDTKKCKGSMVRALDELKKCLVKYPELASLLPLPGRHPVSAYERSIRAARGSPWPFRQ
jgi:hypothetical protein